MISGTGGTAYATRMLVTLEQVFFQQGNYSELERRKNDMDIC